MQSCCIRGCDSYKEAATKNIGYFKFPLHDAFLLKQWRRPIRLVNGSDWEPSDSSQICSVHFEESDFRRIPSQRLFFLLPYSVPSIFPFDAKKLFRKRRRVEEPPTERRERETAENVVVPHRQKVSLLRRKAKPGITKGNGPSEDGTQIESENVTVVLSPVEAVAEYLTLKRENPYFIKALSKKRKLGSSLPPKPQPFETVYLLDHEANQRSSNVCKEEEESSDSDDMEIMRIERHRGSEQFTEQYSQIDDMEIVKIDEDPGSSEQSAMTPDDSRYDCEIESTISNFPEDGGDLGKRLEELRERRKEEQLKIVRLQMELSEVEKKMKENNSEKIVVPNLGKGKKVPRNKSSWLLREKEEYENLLKDVREIKLKVLRERHDRELKKIKILHTQMINLGRKMRENDEKELALSNMRAMNNTVAVRPDWMKREEEEYEKLLDDVRQIKEIYSLRKKIKNENDFGATEETDAKEETEKNVRDEDCVIIETTQENDTHIVDDESHEYGEVIGEIDEDSIDVDMRKGETISFNEDLSDPGLFET